MEFLKLMGGKVFLLMKDILQEAVQKVQGRSFPDDLGDRDTSTGLPTQTSSCEKENISIFACSYSYFGFCYCSSLYIS